MYSTAGHRQQRWTKHNPQQVAKNQPTEAKLGREKKNPLKLPNLKIHSLKKYIKYELQEKCQMVAVQGKVFNTFLTKT